MLMRWDPFRDLDRLTEQVWGGPARTARPFPMDAYRRGDRFFVHFDLPGVAADDIDITVEKDVLTVKVERDWQPGEGDEVVVAERPRGSFSRQLFLGKNLDADHLEASYADGVLTLVIPMAEAAKPRKVSIASGGAGHPQAIEAEHGERAAAGTASTA